MQYKNVQIGLEKSEREWTALLASPDALEVIVVTDYWLCHSALALTWLMWPWWVMIPIEVDGRVLGQFGTRTIWHRGQFGTAHVDGQFGTRTIWHRTIWHRGQFGTADNLAPGQFGTADNLAPPMLAVYIQYKCIFFKIHIPTNTLQLTYISQLLAEYI